MTIQLLREVPGTIGGAPSTFYLVHDDACPERQAVIHLDSPDSLPQLERALDDMGRSRLGQIWDHLAQLLSVRAFWPVWLRMAEEARVEGERVRHGQPLLRYCEATHDPRARHRLCRRIGRAPAHPPEHCKDAFEAGRMCRISLDRTRSRLPR